MTIKIYGRLKLDMKSFKTRTKMLWLQQDLKRKAACQAVALVFSYPDSISALGYAFGTHQVKKTKFKRVLSARGQPCL